jgi:flagellar assembly protein FliH
MPSFDAAEQRSGSEGFVPVPFEGYGEDERFEKDTGPGPQPGAPAASEAVAAKAVSLSAEEIRQEGYDAGHREGTEAARAELPWQEAEALIAAAGALEEAGRSVTAIRRSYLASHRQVVVDLALEIAQRVVGHEISTSPDALVGIIERSLALVEASDAPVVLLATADHEILGAGGAPQLQRLAEEGDLQFEADASLAPGDVRVRSGNMQVDGRLSELLRRVREELGELLDIEEAAQ